MFRGTPNTNGRPKGSSNKTTNKVKEAFTNLLENNLERLQDDLDSLDPKDRLKIILELASYTTPKLRAVEMTADIQNDNKDLLERLMSIPEEQFNKEFENGQYKRISK